MLQDNQPALHGQITNNNQQATTKFHIGYDQRKMVQRVQIENSDKSRTQTNVEFDYNLKSTKSSAKFNKLTQCIERLTKENLLYHVFLYFNL